MTPRSLRLLALVPALAALACSSSTAPRGGVTARATTAGILATNNTTRPIFYTAVERNGLALYDFGECYDAAQCPPIIRGGSGVVPWSRVALYKPQAKEFVFIWWQAPESGREQLRGSVVVTR